MRSHDPRAIIRLALAVTTTISLHAAESAPTSERRHVVARVGEVALALHSVSVRRSVSQTLDTRGAPLHGRSTDRTDLTLEFTLGSRSPDALAAVVAGAIEPPSQLRAIDDRGRPCSAASAEVVAEDEATRLRIKFPALSPAVRSLRGVEGVLTAYPRARRVRFHVPWTKEDLPISVEYEGARATLRKFHLVGDESTLWIAIRPPEGMQVADPARSGSLTARAMDIYGNLVSGGAITEMVRTMAGAEPEFRFYAPVLRRIPSRLMLDVLCVSGEPRPVRFKTRPIELNAQP